MVRCRLAKATFRCAVLSDTVLADCTDLHEALDLDRVNHLGPSYLDHRTMLGSLGGLPHEFLRGAGLGEVDIAALIAAYRVLR